MMPLWCWIVGVVFVLLVIIGIRMGDEPYY